MNFEYKDELDKKIVHTSKGTRAKWHFLAPAHEFMRKNFRWYYNWHSKDYSKAVHALILAVYLFGYSAIALLVGLHLLSQYQGVSAATFTDDFSEERGELYSDWHKSGALFDAKEGLVRLRDSLDVSWNPKMTVDEGSGYGVVVWQDKVTELDTNNNQTFNSDIYIMKFSLSDGTRAWSQSYQLTNTAANFESLEDIDIDTANDIVYIAYDKLYYYGNGNLRAKQPRVMKVKVGGSAPETSSGVGATAEGVPVNPIDDPSQGSYVKRVFGISGQIVNGYYHYAYTWQENGSNSGDSDFFYNRTALADSFSISPVFADNELMGKKVGIGAIDESQLGGVLFHENVLMEVSPTRLYFGGTIKNYGTVLFAHNDRFIGAQKYNWDFTASGNGSPCATSTGYWGPCSPSNTHKLGIRVDYDDTSKVDNRILHDVALDSAGDFYVFGGFSGFVVSDIYGQKVDDNPSTDPQYPPLVWNSGAPKQINKNTSSTYRGGVNSFVVGSSIYLTWFTNENGNANPWRPAEDVYGQRINTSNGESVSGWTTADRPFVSETDLSDTQIRSGSFAASHFTGTVNNPLVMVNMMAFVHEDGWNLGASSVWHGKDAYSTPTNTDPDAYWYADVRVTRFDPSNPEAQGDDPWGDSSNQKFKTISFNSSYRTTYNQGGYDWDYFISKQIDCTADEASDFQSATAGVFGQCVSQTAGNIWKVNINPTLPVSIDADQNGEPDSGNIDIKYYVRTAHFLNSTRDAAANVNANGFSSAYWKEIDPNTDVELGSYSGPNLYYAIALGTNDFTDPAQLPAVDAISLTYYIDNQAPTATVNAPTTPYQRATFNITTSAVTDPGGVAASGADRVRLYRRYSASTTPPTGTFTKFIGLDDDIDDGGIGEWTATLNGPDDWTLDLDGGGGLPTNLKDGAYSLSAIAVDEAGNIEAPAPPTSAEQTTILDSQNPIVASTSPPDGYDGPLSLSQPIDIFFNDNPIATGGLDVDTLCDGSTITRLDIFPSVGTLSCAWSNNDLNLQITHSDDFNVGLAYTVTIQDGVTDKAGNPLGVYSFNFTPQPLVSGQALLRTEKTIADDDESGSRFSTSRNGETLTYTISLYNDGDAETTADITDTLPVGVTYVPSSANYSGVYNSGPHTVTWSGIAVAGSSSVTDITFQVTIDNTWDTGDSFANLGTVSYPPDPILPGLDVIAFDAITTIQNYPVIEDSTFTVYESGTPLAESNINSTPADYDAQGSTEYKYTLTIENTGYEIANIVATNIIDDTNLTVDPTQCADTLEIETTGWAVEPFLEWRDAQCKTLTIIGGVEPAGDAEGNDVVTISYNATTPDLEPDPADINNDVTINIPETLPPIEIILDPGPGPGGTGLVYNLLKPFLVAYNALAKWFGGLWSGSEVAIAEVGDNYTLELDGHLGALDATGPDMTSAVAGGSVCGLNAGDTVTLSFDIDTDEESIDSDNIDSILVLQDGDNPFISHTWGGVTTEWTAADTLVVTFTDNTGTIIVGDNIYIAPDTIEDPAGDDATGSPPAITGSFGDCTAICNGLIISPTAPDTVEVNQWSDLVTVIFTDDNGDETNVPLLGGDVTVNLSSNSGTGLFQNLSGTTTDTIYINPGESRTYFKYKDSETGDHTLTASKTQYCSDSDDHVITVYAGALPPGVDYKLEFITPAQTLNPDELSAKIQVERQDGNSEGVPVSADTTLDLDSDSAGGEFYSDASGTDKISSVLIPDGQSKSNFLYYRDSNAGIYATITADEDPSQNWLKATQVVTILTTTGDVPNPGDDPGDEEEGGTPTPSIFGPVGNFFQNVLDYLRLLFSDTFSAIKFIALALALLDYLLYFRFLNFLIYLLYLLNYYLEAVSEKKRKRDWGQVYDSVTKQPVDLAVVRLFGYKDTEKVLLATKVSDREGRFGFAVEPGKYWLEVDKHAYDFPSKLVPKGFVKDDVYTDIYHGESVEMKSSDVDKSGNIKIALNVPVDPLAENQVRRKVLGEAYLFGVWISAIYWVRINLKKVVIPLLLISFAMNAYSLWVNEYPLDLIFLGITSLLLVKEFRDLIGRPAYGIVYDAKTKAPVANVLVQILDRKYKVRSRILTDNGGHFYFLVPKGKYILKASKPGYEFPSKIVRTKNDPPYHNVYSKGEVEMKRGGVIATNIPIDKS